MAMPVELKKMTAPVPPKHLAEKKEQPKNQTVVALKTAVKAEPKKNETSLATPANNTST